MHTGPERKCVSKADRGPARLSEMHKSIPKAEDLKIDNKICICFFFGTDAGKQSNMICGDRS